MHFSCGLQEFIFAAGPATDGGQGSVENPPTVTIL
jgi:hypothetical protein